ncbi:MAG: hypothetical protein QE271_00225 [Bacteriovoracaceae bacterium]|nr:hypothetical protein [Bacteriovoracaceae bacterium]
MNAFLKKFTLFQFKSLLLLIFLLNCGGKKELEKLNKIVPVTSPLVVYPSVEICNIAPNEEVDGIDVIISLDNTGSNVAGPGGGSDPDRRYRYDLLIEWADTRLINPLFKNELENYALIEFNLGDTIVNGQANGNFNQQKPFLKLQEFRDLVAAQKTATNDSDGTPYARIIKKAEELVIADLKIRKEKYAQELLTNPAAKKSLFQVLHILVTDGQNCSGDKPDGGVYGHYGQVETDPYTCPQFGQVDVTGPSGMLQLVKDFVTKLPAHPEWGQYITYAQLNTVYYQKTSASNPFAKFLLKDMAEAGYGVFFDATGGPIPYDQVIKLDPKNINNTIVDWGILPRNAKWDEENTEWILLDSDADGVADVEEFPAYCVFKESCNDSGVRDFVYYRFYKKSCKLIAGPNGVDVCASEIATICGPQGKPRLDNDGDGLYNCEEDKLGSNPELPDSDANGITDFYSVMRNYPITNPLYPVPNPAGMDQDDDKLSDYQEIVKTFTPWKIDNSLLDFRGLKPITRTRTSFTFDPIKGIKCEYFRIDNVPTLKPNQDDLLQFDVIMQQTSGQGEKIIYTAIEPLVKGQANIKWSDFKIRVQK